MKTFFTLTILLFSLHIFAQSDPNFRLFQLNPTFSNPAANGVLFEEAASFYHKNQWDGRFNSYYINYEKFVEKWKSGIGFNILRDIKGRDSGDNRTTHFSLAYNYRVGFSENSFLAIGLQFGAIYAEKDLDLRWGSAIQEWLMNPGNNPSPPTETFTNSGWGVDVDAGIWLKLKNFNAGFSLKHLPETEIEGDNFLTYSSQRASYLQVDYLQGIFGNWSLRPNARLRTQGINKNFLDTGLALNYSNYLEFGSNYHWKDDLQKWSWWLSGRFWNLQIGGLYVSKKGLFGDTFELLIRYNFGKDKKW